MVPLVTMQLRQLLSVLVAARVASAVNMTNYSPLPGVPAEFRAFLEAYARNPLSNLFEPLDLMCCLQARGSG